MLLPQVPRMDLSELGEFFWCAARLYHKNNLEVAKERLYNLVFVNENQSEQDSARMIGKLQYESFGILCKVLWSLSILGELNYEVGK